MKAIVYHQYGSPDVLQIEEVEKPAPKDGQVLVRIHAAAINAADWHLLRADPFLARFFAGLWKPKFTILGADIAGTIEAVGSNVKELKPKDEVFGDISADGFGGFAEFVCARESSLVLKPTDLSFDEAAAVPLAANTALMGLRDVGRVQAGQKVLINGASGGVGTFAVQIAKWLGAEVTAVCSARNLEMVRSLGADHVIDYTMENFTEGEKRYDVILAANGFHPLSQYRRALNPGGMYVMTGGSTRQMFQVLLLGPWISMTGNKKMVGLSAKPVRENLILLKELLESGKVKPVIDKRFPLSRTADAIRYMENEHARGKVVVYS